MNQRTLIWEKKKKKKKKKKEDSYINKICGHKM